MAVFRSRRFAVLRFATPTLAVLAVIIATFQVSASDPVIRVGCLCVSKDAGRAEGMTGQTWSELAPSLGATMQNNLFVVLAPVERVDESQIRVCEDLTKQMRAGQEPYLASEKPVRIELWLITKHQPKSEYRTSLYGKLY